MNLYNKVQVYLLANKDRPINEVYEEIRYKKKKSIEEKLVMYYIEQFYLKKEIKKNDRFTNNI